MEKKEYKYIGKNCVRKDAYEIVQGKAIFTDDYAISNLLYGKSMKSPYAHANIISIDTSEAKKLPGVHAVLTHEDCDPNWKFGWPPQKSVLSKRLMYAGDPVAIVAADTLDIAKAAIDLIKVEYEVLTPVYSPREALKDGAPQLYEEFDHNIVPPGYPPIQPEGPYWHLVRGDADKAFEDCEYVIEDSIDFDKKAVPCAPEPPGAIARWDGGNDYTVWGTSQSAMCMSIFNESVIPGIKIHGMTFNTGGSYGNKNALSLPVIYAILLARATNRTVKFFESKVDQFLIHETRLGSQVTAKVGIDKDGYIKAVKGLWAVDAGSHSNATQGQIGVGLGEAQIIMGKCKNWDFDSRLVVTNKNPAGVVRGYGGQELNSCLSLLMVKAMRAGNFDPVECFKKNFVSAGDEYIWRDGRMWKCNSVDYKPAIEASAKKFRWSERWKGWGVPTWTSTDGKKVRGIGCSVIGNADVGESWTEAHVHVVPRMFEDACDVVLQMDITESGMGQKSNVCKMVAEVLNVPYENVKVVQGDNLLNGGNTGLVGSRGTITNGRAASNAAAEVKRQLFELAEPFLHVPTEFMELSDFCVRAISRPNVSVPWKALAPQFCTFTGYGKHVENFSTPNFFMNFLEVEVDKETGKVTVIDMLGGTDAGQIIDPAALEMQCQAGIGSASLDTALYEESIYDDYTGRQLTYNMIEYKWRPFNELPHFESEILESQFDTFMFKAVGVGEISGAGAASACMMAISNALGIDVQEYPATPDVILRAVEKADRRGK